MKLWDVQERAQRSAQRRRRVYRSQAVLLLCRVETDCSDDVCLIGDISPIGARLQTAQRLEVGQAVRLDFGDLLAIPARVRWTLGSHAGVEFDAVTDLAPVFCRQEFGSQPAPARQAQGTRRRLPRLRRCAPAVLTAGGQRRVGEMIDVSSGGCRIALAGALARAPVAAVGDPVTIAIEGLPERDAILRWASGGEAGFTFCLPLPLWKLDRWLLAELGKCSTCVVSECAAPSFKTSLTRRQGGADPDSGDLS